MITKFLRLLLVVMVFVFADGGKHIFAQDRSVEVPILTMNVKVPRGSHADFLNAVKKFSSEAYFAILITGIDIVPNDRLIQLYRHDFRFLGVNANDAEKFRFSLFYTCSQQFPKEWAGDLMGHLRRTFEGFGSRSRQRH